MDQKNRTDHLEVVEHVVDGDEPQDEETRQNEVRPFAPVLPRSVQHEYAVEDEQEGKEVIDRNQVAEEQGRGKESTAHEHGGRDPDEPRETAGEFMRIEQTHEAITHRYGNEKADQVESFEDFDRGLREKESDGPAAGFRSQGVSHPQQTVDREIERRNVLSAKIVDCEVVHPHYQEAADEEKRASPLADLFRVDRIGGTEPDGRKDASIPVVMVGNLEDQVEGISVVVKFSDQVGGVRDFLFRRLSDRPA